MKTTLQYKDYATIKNSRSKLQDLRDDDAIQVWSIINTLDEAFKPVQDQVDNVMQQIDGIQKQIQSTKDAVQKATKGQSEGDKQKALEDKKQEMEIELKPKLTELQNELNNLRKKEREAEFEPITKETLKTYDLLTFGILDTFAPIIDTP